MRKSANQRWLPAECGIGFVDMMAGEGDASELDSNFSTPRSDFSQETAYIPIRVLGRGAFGEAVLYRKVEVCVIFSVQEQE